MTEQPGNDKYIKCSACKSKCINDEEHIRTDFGYNRLNERYKTCVTCRDKSYAYSHSERGVEVRATSYENRGRAYNYEKLTCPTCGASVCRNAKQRHERGKGCVLIQVKF